MGKLVPVIVSMLLAAIVSLSVTAAAVGAGSSIAQTRVVNRPQRWASNLCADVVVDPVTHYVTETKPCERKPYPDELVSVQVKANKPTTLGISAFVKAKRRFGSVEAALRLQVDGKKVRTQHVVLRRGKLPAFLLTRLVSLPKGQHEVSLSLLTGSEEMDGIEVFARGIKTAEAEIPRWSNWVPGSLM